MTSFSLQWVDKRSSLSGSRAHSIPPSDESKKVETVDVNRDEGKRALTALGRYARMEETDKPGEF
jgi:hypothetical protein